MLTVFGHYFGHTVCCFHYLFLYVFLVAFWLILLFVIQIFPNLIYIYLVRLNACFLLSASNICNVTRIVVLFFNSMKLIIIFEDFCWNRRAIQFLKTALRCISCFAHDRKAWAQFSEQKFRFSSELICVCCYTYLD